MAYSSASLSGFQPPAHGEADVDDEDEVDQLDSDLDGDEEIPTVNGSPSSSKTRPRRIGERVPGHTLIPPTRVENIMHADGGGGHMSKEALFTLSIATEEFVKRLAEASGSTANEQRRSVVNYRDVASVVKTYPKLEFLQDMIPAPTTLAQALEQRALREKNLAADDPAIAPPPVIQPIPVVTSTPPSISDITKHKTKSRQSNGKEKVNGSASATSTRRQRDSKGRWSQNGEGETSAGGSISANAATRPSSARIRNRSSRASDARESASVNGVPRQNGISSASFSSMPPPAAPRVSYSTDNHSSASMREDAWSPAHYTGPASGFLDDHRLLFNGSRGGGMTDAPGRTIYSQQRPSHSNR